MIKRACFKTGAIRQKSNSAGSALNESTTPEAAMTITIDELAQEFGYVETVELQTARSEWVAAILNHRENTREFEAAYNKLATTLNASLLSAFGCGRELVARSMERGSESIIYETKKNMLATAAALGFTETDDMIKQRTLVRRAAEREPSTDSSKVFDKRLAYWHELADKLKAKLDARFQMGLLLTKYVIQREGGRAAHYDSFLKIVYEYSCQMRLVEAQNVIFAELCRL